MKNFTRRMMLGGGAAALGSLWLPGLGIVEAQEDPVSKRKLLFLYAEGGWVTRHVDFRPPWAPPEWSAFNYYDPNNDLIPDDMEWEFSLNDSRLTEEDFPRILRPLYRHRDIMSITEGPGMTTKVLDDFGDGHAIAHIHSWTGVPAGAEEGGFASRGSAPSTDQRIAEFIQQSDPAHRSMDFRIGPAQMAHEFLWRSDGAGGISRVPFETSPQAAFDRFFGGVASGDPIAANARVALGVALKQFDDLAPRMLGADRKKLEAHREMLGALERQYGAAVSCDSVTRPPLHEEIPSGDGIPDKALSFANIVAAGFACGLSRVANIGSLTPTPDAYGLDRYTNIHHEYEHEIDPQNFFRDPTDTWIEKEEAMTRRNVLQTEYVAKIIDVLRATPDANGGSLLDTTLVVFIQEIAHGVHGHEHYPTLFFGGDGGIVTPGRYIKYAQNIPNPYNANYGKEFIGPSQSRLLVAILQGFGLDIDYLGAKSLEGYGQRTQTRATIELSGPLPRLRA